MGVGSEYEARCKAASTGGESERAWKPLGLSTSIAVDKQTSEESTLVFSYPIIAASTSTVNRFAASVQCHSIGGPARGRPFASPRSPRRGHRPTRRAALPPPPPQPPTLRDSSSPAAETSPRTA